MIGYIYVPYWGHATLLEVLWLVGGVVSLLFTVLNLADSWKDRRALEQIRDDPAVHDRHYRMIELAARGRAESQAVRCVISLLIVATGIVGVVQSNPLRGATTITGLTETGALVVIAALTAARSFLDFRQRATLYELAQGRSSVIAARLRARHGEQR